MKKLYAGLIAAMAVMGIFLACGQGDNPDEFVRRDVAGLQKRTVPSVATMLRQSGPIQQGWSKAARWEFETSWDWDQYEARVISQLQHDFVVRRPEGPRLLFVRSLRGDTEELIVEQIPEGRQLKVKVTFVARPD